MRKHARQQAAEMGMSLRDAATRVFSNSSGSYSSNVNLAVENSSWSDESQLQEMYLKRKSFAFNSDRPGAGGEDGRDIFERALKTVDVTFQVRGGRAGGGGAAVRAWLRCCRRGLLLCTAGCHRLTAADTPSACTPSPPEPGQQ